MRLKIVTVGEPGLRGIAREISAKEIRSPKIQTLIEYMRETVRDAPGVGLAAPQIGEPLQLAVIEDKAEYQKALSAADLAERGRTEIPFHVIVNPTIERLGQAAATYFEGCLSLPGFTALVPRAKEVRVSCLDDHGKTRIIEATGWYARILQHEIDHLHGMLYIDRMHPRSFSSLENYTRHWKDQPVESLSDLTRPSRLRQSRQHGKI